MQQTFYSNGKLLLSGEYAILDGALGLAIPTRYGQSLSIRPTPTGILQWTSFDENNVEWFRGSFALENFTPIAVSDHDIAHKITTILYQARVQNPHFLLNTQGIAVQTHLNFPRLWGLGSSSTLVNNLAQWAQVNPYQLLRNTLGGSGYDIACAQHPYPITYHLKNGTPKVRKASFTPPFKNALHFVYLNQKQNSKAAITAYRKHHRSNSQWLVNISNLTKKMITATALSTFESLVEAHEAALSRALSQPTVKAKLFSDYPGALKSLGAWGGDFVLATRAQENHSYFTAKGFTTIIPYTYMVYSPK